MMVGVAILAVGLAWQASGTPQPFTPQGFRSQITVEIAAPVETVFETATGDVSPWWDHSFSSNPPNW